ncbi:MAG: ABC transporter ATP-binding protein [Acidimicrobiales bacterium]
MTTPSAISCDGLTRSFEHGVAVDHLTFDVPRGSVLALLGHNGAGKTTTIRLLNGVLNPDAGSCRVLGLDPSRDGTELRRRTGVVTENAGLDDRLTARENLEITARLRGISARSARATVDDLLERFGMGANADQMCQGFSTGQRRRLALARALVHDPELLFLDEPTSGLDPAGTRAVMELIEHSARERGRTVVLCTHFLAEAGTSADLMAVMHRGRLLTFGRPADLAAQRWPGLEVHVDLGMPPSPPLVARLIEHRAVHGVTALADGMLVNVNHRDDIPAVVAIAVGSGALVYGTEARPKGLEDVYFAVQDDLAADPSATTHGGLRVAA